MSTATALFLTAVIALMATFALLLWALRAADLAVTLAALHDDLATLAGDISALNDELEGLTKLMQGGEGN